MANILVLIPIKPTLAPALKQRAKALLSEMVAHSTEHWIEAHTRVCPEQGDGRPYSAHAAARNSMLDRYLQERHTHILWIDADVVGYPPDLADKLYSIDSEGIIAPLVLIEGANYFYDTRGFLDVDGCFASRNAPYFLDGSNLIPMKSVGTCYLMPAQPRPRYAPTPDGTEHESVCQGKVHVTRDVTVYHADLPQWGEGWHTYGD